MRKSRLEAFSDGVLAIIITIMVLEMKVPHGSELASIKPLLPVFFSYVLSFIYIGIYWNNHHHMMQVVEQVNGRILWANMHLLFWLSLVPFVSGWMGENNFTTWPVVLYGAVLFMNGVAYYILERYLVQLHGKASLLAKAVGKDPKGILSVFIYLVAIGLAFVNAWISLGLYALVALIWIIPDSRIEKTVAAERNSKQT
ncbi:MAG: TMEM175 family protein [Bacteroidota bacterium]|nr:TMEM175 family protein [Bacteroidota bacterium]